MLTRYKIFVFHVALLILINIMSIYNFAILLVKFSELDNSEMYINYEIYEFLVIFKSGTVDKSYAN